MTGVSPACMPKANTDWDRKQRNCMLTGWGLTMGEQNKNKLQQASGERKANSENEKKKKKEVVMLCYVYLLIMVAIFEENIENGESISYMERHKR